MPDEKVVNETHKISIKRGNGLLRREIWVDRDGKVSRYNLAYINATLFHGDNGRVVGYDNAHDGHHRHWFGEIEPVEWISLENIEERFEQDWLSFWKMK